MSQELSLSDYPKKDLKQARRQSRKILEKYIKDLPELSATCQVSVIIPVYNENQNRLKQQIEAFKKQNFPPENFELFFVINNPLATTANLKKAQKNNQKILAFLKKIKSQIPLKILDRSSAGREMKNGNVGRARNFGLHAVTKRYLSQNRDGIIIQTDADTLPTDKNYLKKIAKTFSTKKIFGAAGGLKTVLDPDVEDKKIRLFYQRRLQIFRDYFEWTILISALHKKNLQPLEYPTRFSGAHMISRAAAAVCAGGIPEINLAEDVLFGQNLEKYAEDRGFKIFPARRSWFLQTAIRESTRTASSFEPIFKNILESDRQHLVKNPAGPLLPDFIKDILIYLQKTKIEQKSFSPFFQRLTQPTKTEFSELQKLKRLLKNKKNREKLYQIYESYCQSKENSPLPDYFRKSLKKLYPPVPLTKTSLKKLRTLVYKDPKRKKSVQSVINYFKQMTLPK